MLHVMNIDVFDVESGQILYGFHEPYLSSKDAFIFCNKKVKELMQTLVTDATKGMYIYVTESKSPVCSEPLIEFC